MGNVFIALLRATRSLGVGARSGRAACASLSRPAQIGTAAGVIALERPGATSASLAWRQARRTRELDALGATISA
jgi:hypothetical protein